MKKNTYIVCAIIAVIVFAIIPIVRPIQHLWRQIVNAAIDWDAWWAFGTFLLTIIAAGIAWFEYEETNRPLLYVYLFNEYTCITYEGNRQLAQYAGLRLENFGKTPAFDIRVTLNPGVPWPLGSHPAGDPQHALMQRKISHLAASKLTDLLFADRNEFDKIAFQTSIAPQTIHISYKDRRKHRFEETYVIDLRDVAYLQSTKI